MSRDFRKPARACGVFHASLLQLSPFLKARTAHIADVRSSGQPDQELVFERQGWKLSRPGFLEGQIKFGVNLRTPNAFPKHQ